MIFFSYYISSEFRKQETISSVAEAVKRVCIPRLIIGSSWRSSRTVAKARNPHNDFLEDRQWKLLREERGLFRLFSDGKTCLREDRLVT